jgi:hypothetical protein
VLTTDDRCAVPFGDGPPAGRLHAGGFLRLVASAGARTLGLTMLLVLRAGSDRPQFGGDASLFAGETPRTGVAAGQLGGLAQSGIGDAA